MSLFWILTPNERTAGTVEVLNLIVKGHDHPKHLRPDVFMNQRSL